MNLEAAILLTRACLKGMLAARLGLDRQYLIGQRASRPCGRLGLQRNEGRPDRIDQKPGGRTGAGRHSRQLRGARLLSERNDQRF